MSNFYLNTMGMFQDREFTIQHRCLTTLVANADIPASNDIKRKNVTYAGQHRRSVSLPLLG